MIKSKSLNLPRYLMGVFVCAGLFLSRPCFSQGAATKLTFPNGVTAIVQPDADSNVVAICLFIRAGIAEEEGVSGIGNLAARSMFGSNDNQSRDAVRTEIYRVGGSLDITWEPDYTLFTCVTTSAGFQDALWVMTQALKSAEFDAETLQDARKDVLADIARENTESFRVAYAALRSRLYDDGPYRLPFGGNGDNLRRLNTPTMQAFFKKRFTPSNTVISVVGNVKVAQVQRAIDNELLDFERPAGRPVRVPVTRMVGESAPIKRSLPTATTLLAAGFRAPGVTEADYPAFRVLEAMVGGGKSSRLFRSVRDVAGVGYAVGTYVPPLAKEGSLLAYVEYDPAHVGADGKALTTDTVQGMLINSIESILKTPPTEAEVERAKRYAAGVHALAHQRTRERAFYLGWYETIGAGYDFDTELPRKIAAVTVDDVKRVAAKVLAKHAMAIITPEK
jgi:zinc protease